MNKNGGGGQGLKAHKSGASVKAEPKVASSGGSKAGSKSSKKKPPRNPYFRDTSTMYRCDGTIRTQKTTKTTTGMSMSGKAIAQDGKVQASLAGAARPCNAFTVDKPIGGTVAVSQLDAWVDSSLNHRASAHLQVMNGLVLEGDTLQCRVSSTNPDQLVISFALSPSFTSPDQKLAYLIEKIRSVYGATLDNGFALDDETCFGILKSHPRYISCKQNLASLRGHLPDDQPLHLEFRMQAPFNIHDSLVTKDEDGVFHGFEISHEDGETNVWFELKEKEKEFKPVTIEKFILINQQAAGRATTSMFQSPLGSIPESVSFVSPTKKSSHSLSRSRRSHQPTIQEDDNSTIKTEDHHGGAGSTVQMDVDQDDDDTTWDSKLGGSEAENPVVEGLRQQVADLTNLVYGLAQTKIVAEAKSFDSDEAGSKSSGNLAGNIKKKKTNEGHASSNSLAGDSKASRRSSATRGTIARDEKRKTGGGDNGSIGNNDEKKKVL